MKKTLLVVLSLFLCTSVFAEMRHTFYERYDPESATNVYDDSGATTTGDVVSVFTYDQKSIIFSTEKLQSGYIEYSIEGRPVGELDTWSIIQLGGFGTASANQNKNFVVEVSELIDYLRVGLRITRGNTTGDKINVRGIFRKGN